MRLIVLMIIVAALGTLSCTPGPRRCQFTPPAGVKCTFDF